MVHELTWAKFLLITKTDLGAVVDLGTDSSILVQSIFAANAEASLIFGGGPAQIHSSLKIRAHLLVNRSSKYLKYIETRFLKIHDRYNP